MAANGVFHFTTAAAPGPDRNITTGRRRESRPRREHRDQLQPQRHRPSSAFSVNCGTRSQLASPVLLARDHAHPTAELAVLDGLPRHCRPDADFRGAGATHMASDFSFTFHTASKPVATNVMINEVDADTPARSRGVHRALRRRRWQHGSQRPGRRLYNGTSTF